MRKILVLALLLLFPTLAFAQGTTACATDTSATELLAFMNRHAFSGDHQTIDDVPDSTETSGLGDRATIVREEMVCRQAAAPYTEAATTSNLPAPDLSGGLTVAMVDNFHFILGPASAGTRRLVVVADESWNIVALFNLYGESGG